MKPTRELVIKVVAAYWPERAEDALTLLDRVRSGGESQEGTARIHLAILKLTDGCFEKLDDYVAMAIQDYREALAGAEYSNEMRAYHLRHFNLTEEEKKELKAVRKLDSEQYSAWLGELLER